MGRFRPGWKATLFVVLLLPLLCWLGNWQLERGAQKRALESAYLDSLTRLPVSVEAMDLAQSFQRVRLHGSFAQEAFLVDNQISQGRTGYWIIQAFDEDSGARLLVNRGFVPGSADRSQLPAIDQPAPGQVVGALWPFLGLIPVLDEDNWPEGWPKRVQRLDIHRMAETLGAMPVEVRLEPGQPGVAQAAPFATVLSDAKHKGYAATWFGLAIVLLIGYIAFGVRTAKQDRSN